MKELIVNLIYRKPYSSQYSIERIFDGLKTYLQSTNNIQINKKVVPEYNNSVWRRFKNILWTTKNQGTVTHITGDIHYVALGLNKQTAILTIHDFYFMDIAKPITLIIYYLLWLKLPLLKVRYVTVISEATKKELLKRISIPESRLKVIPNYYDPRYVPLPKPFCTNKPVLLQIGTKPNKNIPRLIEAITDINCTLVIIGKYEKEIEAILQQKKLDYIWKQNLSEEEVKLEYELCDIVCFASTIEGFGMPILEAQAIGRVVITSSTSAMPEVAGKGAYFIDPFDPNSIREGILTLINDEKLRLKLINQGFNNIKRFHISEIADMYLGLYKELHSQYYD